MQAQIQLITSADFTKTVTMTNLLQIDTSIRTSRSIPRLLAKEFVKQWVVSHPKSTITYRDISQFPIHHVTEEWINPAALSLNKLTLTNSSELLMDEFILNDRYLISLPILNFTIPSTLEAYIDLIARTGLAAAVNKYGSSGLLHSKKLLVVATQRNNYPHKNQDEVIRHFESYLRYIFEYIRLTNIDFIYAYNQSEANLDRNLAIANTRASIKNFIADW
jgi:FMN-dependent NADH-azoreductase